MSTELSLPNKTNKSVQEHAGNLDDKTMAGEELRSIFKDESFRFFQHMRIVDKIVHHNTPFVTTSRRECHYYLSLSGRELERNKANDENLFSAN